MSSGEKMSYQVTILLAEIVYMDMLRSTVPVFENLDFDETPLLLVFFAISITLLCFCLLLTTGTLFLYHCPEYEARNFSETEAKVSRGIAKVSFI